MLHVKLALLEGGVVLLFVGPHFWVVFTRDPGTQLRSES